MSLQHVILQMAEGSLRDLWALLLASIRLMVAFSFVPALGGPELFSLLRLTITLALALVVMPVVRAQWDASVSPYGFLLIVAKEGFLGLLLGFFAGAVFSVVNALGKILDQQVGSTQSSVQNPTLSQPGGPTSQFLVQLATTAVLVSGGLLILLSGLYESFGVWPVWSWWPHLTPDYVSVIAAEFGRQTSTALQLALPFLTLMLVVEIGTGLVSRSVPGLESNALAMSIKHFCVQWLLIVLMTVLLARCIGLATAIPYRRLFELFR